MSDLEARAIERELTRLGASMGSPLEVCAETASTNDDARRSEEAGAPHGATFVADWQTAGRGRNGRVWHSPPRENLYLSVVLRPPVVPGLLGPIPLVVGLAVARALERRLGATAVALKWPNDVFVSGKKLAGILVEARVRPDRPTAAVIAGIGINVAAERFPAELVAHATSLKLLGCSDLDRSTLAAAVLAEMGLAVDRFAASGFASLLPEIERRDLLRGRCVEAGELRGVAEGIDASGQLRVRDARGILHAIVSGEVSARLAEVRPDRPSRHPERT